MGNVGPYLEERISSNSNSIKYVNKYNPKMQLMKNLIFWQFLFLKKVFYLFIFRQRGRERERERNINVLLLLSHPTVGNLARNPGMYPDWELNWCPFGSQAMLKPLSLSLIHISEPTRHYPLSRMPSSA